MYRNLSWIYLTDTHSIPMLCSSKIITGVVQCHFALSSGASTRSHAVPRDPHGWALQAVNVGSVVDQHPNSLNDLQQSWASFSSAPKSSAGAGSFLS